MPPQIRDRIKDLRRVKASELTPNPRNWRKHPPAQQRAMAAALDEIGFADAVLAREVDGGLELIDGHLRTETVPDAELPVLVLDVTEAEADKLLATLDPLAAMATTDAAKLGDLISHLTVSSKDLQQVVDQTAAGAGIEAAPDEVAEPEVPPIEQVDQLREKWKTEPGQVWQLGRHRVACGDCRNADDVARLLDGDQINVAITSPPYASQRKYVEGSGFEPIHPDNFVEWFAPVQENVAQNLADDGSWFVNIKEHCHDGQRVLYVKDLTLAHVRQWGWRFVDEFVWSHGGTPKAVKQRFKNGWEPVFQFAKGKHKFRPDAVRHTTESKNRVENQGWNGRHPSKEDGHGLRMKDGQPNRPKKKQVGSNAALQGSAAGGAAIRHAVEANKFGFAYPSNHLALGKNREALGHGAAFPTSLPAFFIKAFSDPADLVFDPFGGSGSTLIAAEEEGRACAIMDIAAEYVAVMLERWHKMTGDDPKLEGASNG